MNGIQKDWSQQDILDHSKTNGDGDNFLSEDEFAKAAEELSGGKVSEEQARSWFNNIKSVVGESAVRSDGQINFKSMPASQQKALNDEFAKQANGISLEVRAEKSLTKVQFSDIDKNGDKEINKSEWEAYVRNEMPGGNLLPDNEINAMFKMLANPEAKSEGGSELDVISENDFKQAGLKPDGGQSMLDTIQNHATNKAQNPPSETEEMMRVLKELIQTLEEQQQSMANDEFNYN